MEKNMIVIGAISASLVEVKLDEAQKVQTHLYSNSPNFILQDHYFRMSWKQMDARDNTAANLF